MPNVTTVMGDGCDLHVSTPQNLSFYPARRWLSEDTASCPTKQQQCFSPTRSPDRTRYRLYPFQYSNLVRYTSPCGTGAACFTFTAILAVFTLLLVFFSVKLYNRVLRAPPLPPPLPYPESCAARNTGEHIGRMSLSNGWESSGLTLL
jgi:hypothetical protein